MCFKETAVKVIVVNFPMTWKSSGKLKKEVYTVMFETKMRGRQRTGMKINLRKSLKRSTPRLTRKKHGQIS